MIIKPNIIFKFIILLLINIFLQYGCLKEEEIIINDEADFSAYLQTEKEEQGIPAMSVLIFNETNILYENYLGQSLIEQNISLADNHLFLLASISKVVTATALLQLYDDNLFNLEDDINDYLPFEVNIPDYSEKITFKMLLTHTSAIEDSDFASNDQYFYGEDSNMELRYYLENYLASNGEFYNESENFLNFSPGSNFSYSNTGSALIGLLVEEISGLDFNTYCKQNIFEPLNMQNTAWRLDEISGTIVQPYNYENGNYELIEHYTFTDYPNGGLRSTGQDMFQFFKVFLNEGVANNNQILQASTVNTMLTSQIPEIDNSIGLHVYILNEEYNLWGHDGGEQGVSTIAAFNPTTKVGGIIFTNYGDADLEEILVEAYKLGLKL